MADQLQSIRGMSDLLPPQAHHWEWLEDHLRQWAAAYAYEPIRMPILEHTALFRRTIGEGTDIVDKEMFSFPLSNDHYTLRPEGTAGCVRAALQHHLTYGQPRRLWYLGPMFRHERPQKNRYRQFHQFGIESLGFSQPEMEIEHILMTAALWRHLGIGNLRLEINTLGTLADRQRYRRKLVAYLEQHQSVMGEDERQRIQVNPLRLLDSKNPTLASMLAQAPKLWDDMEEASRQRFAALQAALVKLGVAFHVNPTLVRGLDYYNHTVFEWICDDLAPQGTVCAGGRYDGLAETLGGAAMPACGFALGLERTLQLCEHLKSTSPPAAQIFVAYQGTESNLAALALSEDLRSRSLKVEMHCGDGGFKQQLKRAAESGVRVTVILGEQELQENKVMVRDMVSRTQQQVERSRIYEHLSHFI